MRIVFVAGRFNPLTSGHRALIDTMRVVAAETGAQPRIFTTHSHDPQRNPLAPEEKLAFIRRAYPDVEAALAQNAFDAGRQMAQAGVTDATLVVGADRQSLGESFVRYARDLGLERAAFRTVARTEGSASATAAR